MKQFQFILLGAMLGIFILVSGALPIVGDVNSPASTNVTPRYIQKGHEETGSENFVTAVLADYRGFDTLGETTVIFTAGAATILILRLIQKEK